MESIYFWLVYFGIQGAVIGSFLNVVVERLPRGKSLMGRSKCDGCGRILSYAELIPVFSYLFLNGRSKCCKKKLSIRYSIVEASTALIFLIITYFYLLNIQMMTVAAWGGLLSILLIAATSISITLIDFEHHIIPDSLQIVFFMGVLLLTYFEGNLIPDRVGQASLVALPILLLYLATKGKGMGYGDIKLAFSLGMWLGLLNGFVRLYFGFIIGAIYGIVLMIIKRAGRKSHIAFGPFLLFGAWLAFMFGDFVLRLFF